MVSRGTTLVAVLLLVVAPACAQAPPTAAGPPDPANAQDEAAQLEQMLQQMGAPPEARALFSAMAQEDIDPMMLMMLMGMAQGGGGGGAAGEMAGFAMLMRALGSQGKQPTAVVNGDKLLVIEDGVVYRVDLAKMVVDGQVAYRPKKSAAAGLAKLLPLMAAGRGKAEQASCQGNMKRLALSAMMYAQDNGEALPTENWVEEVTPYVNNTQLLRCPAAGEAMPAYGLNEKLIGLAMPAITEPANTVMFFEKDPADGTNVGGPEKLVARHEGGVNIAFADGHVKWMPLDQAMQLKWDPE